MYVYDHYLCPYMYIAFLMIVSKKKRNNKIIFILKKTQSNLSNKNKIKQPRDK